MSHIRKRDLLHTGLRLALFQSTWCEGGMQSVGLAYCLIPGLSNLAGSKKQLKDLVEVCAEPFNTHPYLGGVVAGIALNMAEHGKSKKEIQAFLHDVMGPLAALGDPFLKEALPIFVAAVTAIVAMWGGALLGIVTLLVLFNSVHLVVRIGGVVIGHRDGYGVMGRMGRWLSHNRTNFLRHAAALLIGVVAVKAAVMFGPEGPKWMSLLMVIGGVAASFGLAKWRVFRALFIPIVLTLGFLAEVLV